jgi:hypothetical protein
LEEEKPKDPEENLSQCHLVHHRFHIAWLGRKSVFRVEKPFTNRLSYATAFVDLSFLLENILLICEFLKIIWH